MDTSVNRHSDTIDTSDTSVYRHSSDTPPTHSDTPNRQFRQLRCARRVYRVSIVSNSDTPTRPTRRTRPTLRHSTLRHAQTRPTRLPVQPPSDTGQTQARHLRHRRHQCQSTPLRHYSDTTPTLLRHLRHLRHSDTSGLNVLVVWFTGARNWVGQHSIGLIILGSAVTGFSGWRAETTRSSSRWRVACTRSWCGRFEYFLKRV